MVRRDEAAIERAQGPGQEDYRFFTRKPGGAFGDLRVHKMKEAAEALSLGMTLARLYGGCDVWDSRGRIALLNADEARMNEQK